MRVIKQQPNGYRVCPLREYLVLGLVMTAITRPLIEEFYGKLDYECPQ